MAELKDVVAYLLMHYPHKGELSKARVTKMVYLADWRSSLDNGEPLTGINWYYNNYGPYVNDVVDAAERNADIFDVENTVNFYGSPKSVFRLVDESYQPQLSPSDRDVLDAVIAKTQALDWADFIKFVYSTYPVVSSDKFSTLDLPEKARAYRDLLASA